MLTLIWVITIIALVICLKLRIKYQDSIFFPAMSGSIGLFILALSVAIFSMLTSVATESSLDSQILMYQEENSNIEQNIDTIVKQYLDHEHNTFSNLKTDESVITLVTLFPELKSDALVQKQMEIYVENNAQIKELKKEKIENAKRRWLLYFGN